MGKLKIGVVGIGNMGSIHIKNIRELNNCQLKAVCDINTEALDRVQSSNAEQIACFTDYEQFLSKGQIDAVLIAVPHYDHPDMAIAAMKHGKHIIVEKPIAVHKQEAERLLGAAKEFPGLLKCAMFNQRTIPAHRKIKQLIDADELGDIRRINWIITDWFRTQLYYDSGDWRASWRGEGGGVLLNQCPHQLDLMQWFFGLPEKVRATVKLGKYHNIEVEDEVNAYLEYSNGATGNFIASTGEAPGTNRLEITAERGRLVLEHGKLEFLRNEVPASEFCRNASLKFSIPEYWKVEIPAAATNQNQHRDIVENFANAVLHNEKLIAPLEEGIRGLELGNAMLLSGFTNENVILPVNSSEYATRLRGLIANSRYRKKSAPQAANCDNDFSNSFTN